MRKKHLQYVFAMMVSVGGFLNVPTTVQAAQALPPTSTSWYIYVTSDESDQTLNTWMYNAGYQAGQKDLSLPGTQSNLVVLDFGQPWVSGGVQGVWSFNGTYGRFLSTATIREAVKQFAIGYYRGTGSDTSSIMRIAVGTNNLGSYTTYTHGQAWAQMVKDIGSWLSSTGYGYQNAVRGATDMEMGFSSASTARTWVNGYTNTYASPYYLYNYGDAAGCPQSGTTNTAGSCSNSWTQNDVQYVSWGAAPAFPFPEIYSTTGSNAKQWQQISLYSALAYGSRMGINGPLSESQACAQRGGCTGINNTPDQAWTQLWNALNGDSRTAQNLTWSSDIKWRK